VTPYGFAGAGLSLAFSAGGDGGRKAPEVPTEVRITGGKHHAMVAAIMGNAWEGQNEQVLAYSIGVRTTFVVCIPEEKSPEQHREESNQMFGVEDLQKMDFTRFVASGTKQRIGFFYALHPDCTVSGDVNVRLTKQPEHGTAEIAATTLFPNFEKENIRYKCNQHKVRGQQVSYKAAEKYIGSDTVELLVLYPGGFAREVHLNINVR
jgi:hypothetical protein